MGYFAYVMAALFVIIWAVLLYKLIRIVSSSKQTDEQDEDQDDKS